ncbi:hypothetical protein ACI77O_12570 [Pseudomonas tritici]|uniref:hypothetical protein n=1 Tax=Pseudomonas tritici TaxID=2745518 RepID=UPI00387B538D
MSQLTKDVLFVTGITLMGLLVTFLMFDVKPSASSVLGAFAVPVVFVLFMRWRRGRIGRQA